MYEGYKLFGPYTRKDYRTVVILQHLESKRLKTVSYPKYLIECHLNRYLSEFETIDHINADFTDNRIENLQILSRAENASKSFKDGTAYKGPKNLSPEVRQKKSKTFRGENNPLSKFNEETVLELRILFKNKKISLKSIIEKYQVSEKTARSMLKGKTYAHVKEAITGKFRSCK